LTGGECWPGGEPPWKSILEDKLAADKADKLKGKQAQGYEDLKLMLAQGKSGRNQHDLVRDLKGKKAIDLPGSGKGRGAVRVVFSEPTPGTIVIHDIVDYHTK
jgi:hypothetical protein